MPKTYFLAPIADIWEFQRLLFFFRNVDDYVSAPQRLALAGGVIFGADVYLRPPEDRRGPVIRAGEPCVLFSAEANGFLSVDGAFGVAANLIDVAALHADHLADAAASPPQFLNAAALAPEPFQDMLRRGDPDLEAVIDGRLRGHANAPALTLDAVEAADFYDPRGPEIDCAGARTLLPLLEEQMGILAATAESIANPYRRAMINGVCRFLNEILRASTVPPPED